MNLLSQVQWAISHDGLHDHEFDAERKRYFEYVDK